MTTDQPRLLRSGLTGRVYVVTRYTKTPDGMIVADEKHDVTDDFNELVPGVPSTPPAEDTRPDTTEQAARILDDAWVTGFDARDAAQALAEHGLLAAAPTTTEWGVRDDSGKVHPTTQGIAHAAARDGLWPAVRREVAAWIEVTP